MSLAFVSPLKNFDSTRKLDVLVAKSDSVENSELTTKTSKNRRLTLATHYMENKGHICFSDRRILASLLIMISVLFSCGGGGGGSKTSGAPTSLNTWHLRASLRSEYPRGIAYGNGTFVAVNGNNFLTSSDGVFWTIRLSGILHNLVDITYGGDIFVAMGREYIAEESGTKYNSYVLTSPDGITWSQTKFEDVSVQDIVYGNGIFVIVGDNGTIMTSSDGANWTNRNVDAQYDLFNVTYGNEIFLVIGKLPSEHSVRLRISGMSKDGIDWTFSGVPEPFGAFG